MFDAMTSESNGSESKRINNSFVLFSRREICIYLEMKGRDGGSRFSSADFVEERSKSTGDSRGFFRAV